MKLCFYTETELKAKLERITKAKSVPTQKTGDEPEIERRIREELKYRENRANRMPPNW